jgi:hypothetical protein
MNLPPDIVVNLWLPPAAGVVMSTLAMFRTPLASDWRSKGLYSTLKEYGYTRHEIAVAWLGIAACATGFLYAGILVGYRDWLFSHQPTATIAGIALFALILLWALLLHRRRETQADAKLARELSGITNKNTNASDDDRDVMAASRVFKYWGYLNLGLLFSYICWIARIFRNYKFYE